MNLRPNASQARRFGSAVWPARSSTSACDRNRAHWRTCGKPEFFRRHPDSRGDTIVYARSFGEVRPGCGKLHEPTARWRWASITRQAIATLPCRNRRCGVSIWMRRPAAIGPNLQPQIATRSPARHLLQHISGLPDPDDTALLTASLPEFYGTDFGGWRSKPVVWGLSALHRAPSITITIATSSSLADCLSAGRASR